jgi:hypothetical protein
LTHLMSATIVTVSVGHEADANPVILVVMNSFLFHW